MVTVLDEIRFTVVLLAHKARSYGCADSHPVANRAGLSFCPPLATTPVAAQPRLVRGPGANPDRQSLTAHLCTQKLCGARHPCGRRQRSGWNTQAGCKFQLRGVGGAFPYV